MSDIQNLISLSLKDDNNWREILLDLLKEKFFPSLIYSTFFLLSPNSAKKFTNMSKQALVLAGALKIILAEDGKQLEKSSSTRRLVRRMKRAHKKHKINEVEFHHMKQAILIASMFFLHNKDKSSEFIEYQRGFNNRISSIKHLVIATSIKFNSSSISE